MAQLINKHRWAWKGTGKGIGTGTETPLLGSSLSLAIGSSPFVAPFNDLGKCLNATYSKQVRTMSVCVCVYECLLAGMGAT